MASTATLKGSAVVWGCDGFTATGVVISAATGKTQSIDAARDGEIWQGKDSLGNTFVEAHYDDKLVINIEVLPFNATAVATAFANADSFLAAPGTVVTIVDANSAVTDSFHSGKFTLISSSHKRTNTGALVVSMQIRQYIANDVNAQSITVTLA